MSTLLVSGFENGWFSGYPSWKIPLDGFVCCENIELRQGYIQQRKGSIKVASTNKGKPVMGIISFYNSAGQYVTLIMDTRSLYKLTENPELKVISENILESNSYDFISSMEWRMESDVRIYFTNGLALKDGVNGIYYYEDSSGKTTSFSPSISPGINIEGGSFVFGLAGRMIIIGSMEKGIFYSNRARWSVQLNPDNFDESKGAGFSDAACGEKLISAIGYKNSILVYFSRSVWQLVSTGSVLKPFEWRKISDLYGTLSRKSVVPLGDSIISICDRGIFITDGISVKRIDEKILNFCQGILNSSGSQEIYCYRSPQLEQIWSLYTNRSEQHNNRVLVFNEKQSSFGNYSLKLNCLGEGQVSGDFELQDFVGGYDWSLEDCGNETLQDFQFDFSGEILLGGDLEGNLYQLQTGTFDDKEEITSLIKTASFNLSQSMASKLVYVDILSEYNGRSSGKIRFFAQNQSSAYKEEEVIFLPNQGYLSSILNISLNSEGVILHTLNCNWSSVESVVLYGKSVLNGLESKIKVLSSTEIMLTDLNFGSIPDFVGTNIYAHPLNQTLGWVRFFAGKSGYNHQFELEFKGQNDFRIYGFRMYLEEAGENII